ncbi:NTP transferase domain-containing protein [Candidatus Amarolinea dominans]|uniref:molybdenum cofactor guanylyltransferase n=1 Tax=Candidatus Amarolinea dominans TaxID=3140696 RepID=UPI0031CC9E2B
MASRRSSWPGGESRRMGSNKALLSLDGQPLIARTAACLRPLADELIVVTNTPEAYQFLVADFAARLIPDALLARSALVGFTPACAWPAATWHWRWPATCPF